MVLMCLDIFHTPFKIIFYLIIIAWLVRSDKGVIFYFICLWQGDGGGRTMVEWKHVEGGEIIVAFFRNLLHPLHPQSTTHLCDGEIRLLLRQYQWGSAYVGGLPSYFFSIVDANEMRLELGRCDLRVGWHEELQYAGHIGYRVYVPYRGHHYAAKASRLLLHFAAELGMTECIITCNPDNLPSRRTLEGLGGELRATVEVPRCSACYAAGDRAKCQFYYQTADFFRAEWHNPVVTKTVNPDGDFLELSR